MSKHTTPSDNTDDQENSSTDSTAYDDWMYTGEGSAFARFEHWDAGIDTEQSHLIIHELLNPGVVSFGLTHGQINGEPALGGNITLPADEVEDFAYNLLAMAEKAREMEDEADE